jgi:hypothetical protein
MTKFNNLVFHLGNIFMIVLFMVILATCSVVIWDAFLSLRSANQHIESAVSDIATNLKKEDSSNSGSRALIQSYLEQMKYNSKATLDSNTISFLFQLFAIALVTAGIYLLSRSHWDLREMKKETKSIIFKARMIEPLVHDNQASIIIDSYLSRAYFLSWLLSVRIGDTEGLFPMLRQILTETQNNLYDSVEKKIGIQKSLYDALLDKATFISINLSKLDKPTTDQIKDIISLASEIISTLKRSDFIENYDNHIRKLTNSQNSRTTPV